MSDDLKPCPFCGGEPEWVDIPDDKFSNTGGSVIECMSCGASTHVEFGFKENLIDTWNRRAASRELVPAMADRIEELEAKLAKAVGVLRFYGSICADKDKSPWNVYSEDFGEKARAAIAEINGGGDT